jgi:hypothetical protein
MRRIACLLAVLLLAACHEPGNHHHDQPDAVQILVNSSTSVAIVGQDVALSATVTSQGTVYFITRSWLTLDAPAVPTYRTPSSNETLVRFSTPGIYTIGFRYEWWDRHNDRRADFAYLTIEIVPTGAG